MKFSIPGSKRVIWVNIDKYRVDWDRPTRSKFQTHVKNFLRPYLEKHVVCEELRIPRSRLTVDLIDFTTRTAFEVQGRQHFEYVKHFHRNVTGYFRQYDRDAKKQNFLEHNNYQLIEIIEEDLPLLSVEFFRQKFGLDLRI